MSTPKETIWDIEPHTIAKHKILEAYLKAWFPIINRISNTVNYIDGFAGPGIYSKGELGSPIIALKTANEHNSNLSSRNIFLFIEENIDRAKNLEEEISKLELKKNLHPFVITGKFHEVIEDELKNLETEGKILAPTFLFIDPFGFSGVPAKLIDRLLQIPKVEVFINFSVDSINRFIGTKEGDAHIQELFGSKDISEIIKNYSTNRIRDLRDTYQLLLSTYAKFIRYFEMRNEENRPIYYLFFATNSEKGHLKMKEAMWSVDKEGDFKFSDATDQNQIIMFENKNYEENVFDLIKEKFGTGRFDVADLRKYVENSTGFLDKHFSQAMRHAESNSFITVEVLKKDGKKRRGNTFPDGTFIQLK